MGHLPCDFEDFWGSLAPYLGKQNHPWRPLSLPQYHMVLPLYDTNFMHYLLFKNPPKFDAPPKKLGGPPSEIRPTFLWLESDEKVVGA